jgi:VanZ like family/Concanavalin A-like lectin/glucanases superfamily
MSKSFRSPLGGPFWSLSSLIILVVVLALGLWPFHSPPNAVAWLHDRNGLHLGRFNTVVTFGSLPMGSRTSPEAGLEIWLQPDRIWESHTVLAFYTPEHPFQFSLRQVELDLELITENPYRGQHLAIRFPHAFRQSGPVFITLTSGLHGTILYVDGIPTHTSPQLRLPPEALTGRMVIGDSPGQADSWPGRFLGLAIYRQELTPSQILDDYTAWTATGQPSPEATNRALALYLFDEHRGMRVHNRAGSNPDLYLYFPQTYEVMNKLFLQPAWSEFSWSRDYGEAVVKNVAGFVPLGFCLCAYFADGLHLKRPVLITAVLGCAVSLAIEILQAYLPTRDSGMTDIIANTLGTIVGAQSYSALKPILSLAIRL